MTNRVYRNNRLVYYGKKGSSPEFWTSHWENVDWRAWLDGAKNGGLGYFETPVVEFLPKTGKILEAGCGLGQFVVALRARGYDVEGVEFSEDTVSMVKSHLRDCPIKVGDVRRLEYPDSYFSAYLSFGVVEHFEEGPEPILREARRVLKDGGCLFVSVPRVHAIRKLKGTLGLYSSQAEEEFYQYAFGTDEIAAIVTDAGFSVKSQYYYDAVKGIKDEVAVFNYFYKRDRIPQRILRKIRRNPWLNQLAFHMVLLIAEKE